MTVVIPIVAGIGNALMAVPMARQIKRAKPDARVIILARTKAMAEPFSRLPEVDEVHVTGGGAGGYLKLVRLARRAKADVYLVPFPSNRWQYNLLASVSGAKRVVMHGYPKQAGFSFLIRQRVAAVRGIHDVVQNLALLGVIGIEPDEREAPTFVVDQSSTRERLRVAAAPKVRPAESAPSVQPLHGETFDVCVTSRPFIALHAGSAQTILAQAKRWPAANYARLIELLREALPHEFVMLEGPDEAGVAEEIVGLLANRDRVRIEKLAGPLAAAAALLKDADLYVGTDSGLAHLAAAVGTRAVTLFAPADPDRVSPFGNRDLVIQPPCACSPCFSYPWESTKPAMRCSPPYCIEQIAPEVVAERVLTEMKSRVVDHAESP